MCTRTVPNQQQYDVLLHLHFIPIIWQRCRGIILSLWQGPIPERIVKCLLKWTENENHLLALFLDCTKQLLYNVKTKHFFSHSSLARNPKVTQSVNVICVSFIILCIYLEAINARNLYLVFVDLNSPLATFVELVVGSKQSP